MIAAPLREVGARSAPSSRGTAAAGAPAAPALPDSPTEGAPAPINDGTQSSIVASLVAALARAVSPADLALEAQREAFDQQTRMRAELERESNALRDLAMQQVKDDDELLKKWIAMA